jgi:hypothetical protein
MPLTHYSKFSMFTLRICDRRLLNSQCCLSTGLVANGIRLTKRFNALSSRSVVTRGLSESQFLLHVTDGRVRVWRHKNTAYTPRNIQQSVPYGGGSVMVWGCISHPNMSHICSMGFKSGLMVGQGTEVTASLTALER